MSAEPILVYGFLLMDLDGTLNVAGLDQVNGEGDGLSTSWAASYSYTSRALWTDMYNKLLSHVPNSVVTACKRGWENPVEKHFGVFLQDFGSDYNTGVILAAWSFRADTSWDAKEVTSRDMEHLTLENMTLMDERIDKVLALLELRSIYSRPHLMLTSRED